jgi:hypothetical protein
MNMRSFPIIPDYLAIGVLIFFDGMGGDALVSERQDMRRFSVTSLPIAQSIHRIWRGLAVEGASYDRL